MRQPLPSSCRDTVTGNAFFHGCVDELTWLLEDKSTWVAGLAMTLATIQVGLYTIFQFRLQFACCFSSKPKQYFKLFFLGRKRGLEFGAGSSTEKRRRRSQKLQTIIIYKFVRVIHSFRSITFAKMRTIFSAIF